MPLGDERTRVGFRHLAAEVCLPARDAPEILGEPTGALGERRLEPNRESGGNPQGLVEPLRDVDEPFEPHRVGAAHIAQVRNRRERLGGGTCALRRLVDAPRCLFGVLGKPLHLDAQLAAASVELQQERLGGLAGEPELAPCRVPADPVLGYRADGRRKQLIPRHDRQVCELARVATDKNDDRPEPGRLRLDNELEPPRRVGDEHRGGAIPERRRDRPLTACLDLEGLQSELLALLGERARRRRQSFALSERLLERGEPFTREPHTCVEILTLAHRGARSGVGVVGSAAELGRWKGLAASAAHRRAPSEAR